MVIANFNAVLMDKKFWDDPEDFRPERFIDTEGKVHVPDNYLPFGFGKGKRHNYDKITIFSHFYTFYLIIFFSIHINAEKQIFIVQN